MLWVPILTALEKNICLNIQGNFQFQWNAHLLDSFDKIMVSWFSSVERVAFPSIAPLFYALCVFFFFKFFFSYFNLWWTFSNQFFHLRNDIVIWKRKKTTNLRMTSVFHLKFQHNWTFSMFLWIVLACKSEWDAEESRQVKVAYHFGRLDAHRVNNAANWHRNHR